LTPWSAGTLWDLWDRPQPGNCPKSNSGDQFAALQGALYKPNMHPQFQVLLTFIVSLFPLAVYC
jgi:hypothetical protein